MTVIFSPRAEKEAKKLHKLDALLIYQKTLKLDRGVGDIKKLEGYKGLYRLRIGQYRVIYRHVENTYYVEMILHRKEVYQAMKRVY
ncbi:MAG: type II toxin-antitoxin system RelE/ParE family toxin [bacterium]